MTHNDFARALDQDLRLRGAPFDQGDLLTFVEDVWPAAWEDPIR